MLKWENILKRFFLPNVCLLLMINVTTSMENGLKIMNLG